MAVYLLKEDGSKLILEDGSGFLLLENQGVSGFGILVASAADVTGAGSVTGTGTPSTRKHHLSFDPPTILNRP